MEFYQNRCFSIRVIPLETNTTNVQITAWPTAEMNTLTHSGTHIHNPWATIPPQKTLEILGRGVICFIQIKECCWWTCPIHVSKIVKSFSIFYRRIQILSHPIFVLKVSVIMYLHYCVLLTAWWRSDTSCQSTPYWSIFWSSVWWWGLGGRILGSGHGACWERWVIIQADQCYFFPLTWLLSTDLCFIILYWSNSIQ